MPLTAAQRAAYGEDWPEVSREVRDRAGGRCECAGECAWVRHLAATEAKPARDVQLPGQRPPVMVRDGRCDARNGQPSPYTGSRVVLTVAHLDHNPGTNDRARLKAMCQGCHLAYDRPARHADQPVRRGT